MSQPAKRPAFNRPPAAASQSSGGQDAVFERLLRFSLFQATALDHVQQACNIVFVLNSSDLQQKMLKQCELWDQLKPQQPHGLDGKYVPHQLEERKLFLFVSMMDALGELQSVSSEAPVATAVKKVQDMNVETNLAFCVGAFGPRHATPKANRPWVFEFSVGACAPETFRSQMYQVMIAVKTCKQEDSKVEPMKRGPVGLRPEDECSSIDSPESRFAPKVCHSCNGIQMTSGKAVICGVFFGSL